MKRFFLTFLILLTLLKTYGQFNYLVEGGSCMTSITGRDSKNYDGFRGYYFGVGVEKMLSESFGLNLCAYYKTRGYTSEWGYKTISLNYNFKDDVEQSTLNIPLLAIYKFKRVSLLLGLHLDFVLKSRQHYQTITWSNTDLSYYIEEKFYNKDRLARTEPGLTMGFKVNVIRNFEISFKYLLGYKPVSPKFDWNYYESFQIALVKKIEGSSN